MPDGEREGLETMDETYGEGDTHACTKHELTDKLLQVSTAQPWSPHSERMSSYVSGCVADGFGHGRAQRPNYGVVLLSTRLGRSRWLCASHTKVERERIDRMQYDGREMWLCRR
jgi:hypothetical protein